MADNKVEMSNEMSDETICQKWKNKICQKLRDIENTNGLEEHLSECTNDMGCRVEPNSIRKAKNTIYQDYLMMRLKHDAQIENKVPLKISGIELVFACRRCLLHLNSGTNWSCIFLK